MLNTMGLGKKEEIVLAFAKETPSAYAERLGLLYASNVTDDYKKHLGQFFTPLPLAKFMADFCIIEKSHIKILDPGCGIGILSIMLIEVLTIKYKKIKVIELVAFETDVNILTLADSCFKYLGKYLDEMKVEFTFFLCKNDFILHNSTVVNNEKKSVENYDIVISNPPYFKLPKDDERTKVVKSVTYGQSNIYTIFLLIAAKLLKENGQLIFITPRSFCSGNYYRLFRQIFFSIVDFKNIHLFSSRKVAFKKDKVLLENLIITAKRKEKLNNSENNLVTYSKENIITVSSSDGIEDIDKRRIKDYKSSDLINFDSYQKIIHLPSSEMDEKIIDIFKGWTGSLKMYNLEISTGPVVDFRSIKMIKDKKGKNTVPLIWLHNVESMSFVWPKINTNKGKYKEQYIINDETSLSRLVKNNIYVLLRRFSSKDDHRRLIAAPYFPNNTFKSTMIGIENHLNYIYSKDSELTIKQAFGLAAIFNSRLFDLYFRTFNGNINVSATELRDFPLPDFDLIQSLGERVYKNNQSNKKSEIDVLVSEIFNLSIDLVKNYG